MEILIQQFENRENNVWKQDLMSNKFMFSVSLVKWRYNYELWRKKVKKVHETTCHKHVPKKRPATIGGGVKYIMHSWSLIIEQKFIRF